MNPAVASIPATRVKRRRTARKEEEPAAPVNWLRILGIASLALLCPFLGGAESAPAVILLALGLLLWLDPPSRILPLPFTAIFVAPLVFAAASFRPAGWLSASSWRSQMENLGMHLPVTATPQPWLTLNGMVLFMAGLAWMYYLCVQVWNTREHRIVLQLYAGGVLVIVLLAIVLNSTGASLPFWKSERHFGPFANRNNTANLFAFAGLAAIACGYHEFRRSKILAALWAAGSALALAGLIFSYSKSGIIIFFGSAAAWIALVSFYAREKRVLSFVASAVFILATLFLIKGGGTLDRFGLGQTHLWTLVSEDYRWKLHKDGLAMGLSAPALGVGLGNFTDVFPQFRRASFGNNRALHPDSDWVWLQAEMGWLTVLALVAGCVLFARSVPPLTRGSNRYLRLASAVAGIFFIIHGFVNVSGHQMGTVFPALLLASLALSPARTLTPARWIAPVFRLLAIIFGIAGAVWVIAFVQHRPLPGYLGKKLWKNAAKTSYGKGRFEDVIVSSTHGLQIAPLDWEFYYLRGSGRALLRKDLPLAQEDFRRARFLIPASWQVPYQEGYCLLQADPKLVEEPWAEALTRATEEKGRIFSAMVSMEDGRPELRPILKRLARGDWDREILILSSAKTEPEFSAELLRLTEWDGRSRMSELQRRQFIQLWAARGDRKLLVEKLNGDPEWLNAGWAWLAKYYATSGSHEAAYRIARKYLAEPRLPPLREDRSIIQLKKQLVIDPKDFVAGYRLSVAQMQANEEKNALWTVGKLTAQPGCPAYLFFIRAELQARQEDWSGAWQALQEFEPGLK